MDRDTYRELVEQIRFHMKKYYDQDEAEISDYEYDQLMLRLKAAEKEHPEWVTPDSPSQVVGAKAASAKRTAGVLVTHDVPMLSIEDVFSKEEVIEWVRSVRAMHADASFVVEEKIDGLSMSLRYENGKLVLAETRGDGFTGEDVTLNAREVAGVLQTVGIDAASLEVRGEVYMTHEAFAHTNAMQEALGKKTFANPRNCAAGTLRILDPKVTRERGLSFFVFNIQRTSEDAGEALMTSHHEGLARIAEAGIPVASGIVCKTEEEVLAAIDAIGSRRGSLPYDIDGAVVKLDRIAYRDDFPAGSKYSAGHIAYKYPPEEKEAVITDIELSVGMTGRINPTAIFTPVQLCGTTVSRATLHNQDFIDKLGIGIGKTVLVYKSGEIIPKIRGTVLNGSVRTEEDGTADIAASSSGREAYRRERGIFEIPDTCPVCGAPVVRGRGTGSGALTDKASGGSAEDAAAGSASLTVAATGERTEDAGAGGAVSAGPSSADAADMYCVNNDCPAKLVRRVINFVSRDAMDIKGFGTEYITKLIEENYIRNIGDIYTLKQHRDELVEKGLIGKDKNTDKLLDVIEKSKENEPWRLLSGLAIANVGRTGARTIMRHFKSLERLQEATEEELLEVSDVGKITAQGIRAWFDKPEHATLLQNLREAGVRMDLKVASTASAGSLSSGEHASTNVPGQSPEGAQQPGIIGTVPAGAEEGASSLAGRTYVVTGDLVHFKNRDELTDFIEARGGKVAGSVSKKTYALINNDAASNSGKNKKARELGIPVLTEDAFLASL